MCSLGSKLAFATGLHLPSGSSGSKAHPQGPGRAQALRHGVAAALWEHAVRGISPPSPPCPADGAGARDRLAHAVATVLGDLFVFRGDDTVAAAVLLFALDARGLAWFSATVHGSRPLRVAAAGMYLLQRILFCSFSCLGVSAGGGPLHPPLGCGAPSTRLRERPG